MIWLTAHYGEGAIELLSENHSDHLMGKRHLGKRNLGIGTRIHFARESVCPADHEDDVPSASGHLVLEH